MRRELGVQVRAHDKLVVADAALREQVRGLAMESIVAGYQIPEKHDRYAALSQAKKNAVAALKERLGEVFTPTVEKLAKAAVEDLKYEHMRELTVNGGRIGNRAHDGVRTITCEVGLLPRVHGSALFTRGETQALVACTLGTSEDEQRLELLSGQTFKKFMLHYNFPPFSVGETKPLRGPGRREIGHGALAERALRGMLPKNEDFPYTIRIVSDILESNGSSSMASVCGGTLCLMDAGVPIKAPVAGIAMGLVKEGQRIAILSDILGDEDHLGDMDFKVCGTRDGITSIQMDIKITGLTTEIMSRALEQARRGRLHILGEMLKAIDAPRKEISPYAPRITTIMIRPEFIKNVIGPGGKVIKDIIARTGATINIEDSGRVDIASNNSEAVQQAISMIQALTREAEVGKIYLGTVRRVRRLRGAVPRNRWAHPHLRAVGQAGEERLRRPQGGRRGDGEGHQHRSDREDPSLSQGGPGRAGRGGCPGGHPGGGRDAQSQGLRPRCRLCASWSGGCAPTPRPCPCRATRARGRPGWTSTLTSRGSGPWPRWLGGRCPPGWPSPCPKGTKRRCGLARGSLSDMGSPASMLRGPSTPTTGARSRCCW
jgi:polyribonucleotide nucleotidyltransferase